MWWQRTYSGEEAVGKLQEAHPDLVLMDIVLAGKMDGIEAAEKIAESSGTPVVYLTAYADDTTFRRATLTGPSGYILKPVEKKQLHVTIELALHKQGITLNLQKHHARIYTSMKDMIKAIAENGRIEGSPMSPAIMSGYRNWATAMAREMWLTDFQVEGVELASAIHDIGTVNIPA